MILIKKNRTRSVNDGLKGPWWISMIRKVDLFVLPYRFHAPRAPFSYLDRFTTDALARAGTPYGGNVP